MLKKADTKIHKSSNVGLMLMLYFCLAKARKWQQTTIV